MIPECGADENYEINKQFRTFKGISKIIDTFLFVGFVLNKLFEAVVIPSTAMILRHIAI